MEANCHYYNCSNFVNNQSNCSEYFDSFTGTNMENSSVIVSSVTELACLRPFAEFKKGISGYNYPR